MYYLANPNRFLRLSGTVLPWCAGATVLLLIAGLALGLFVAPPDYRQGESVRIMYVHVPAAWMALLVYSSMAAASAVALIWKHPLADLTAKAAAPIGACFTFIALATGALWGQPIWNTWWVWDARLTSMLILFFLYLGYIALSNAFEDPARGARAAAILALVGFVNVPIIKFSVDWWTTLHQPASVIKIGTPSIHASMLVPLFLMALAFTGYFLTVLILRLRSEILARKIRSIQLARVQG
ncbi:MAG: heme ABC transporter permease [Proteobacteria bacterium]|nr:heme ABC transporter permease [Pseudomonadota bacterium]